MSINLYSRLTPDSSYKLVQLTPELLETLRNGRESEIKFKALDKDKSDVVLCTKDKTWVIKQKNHSNTVMLLREFVPEEQNNLNEKALFGMPYPTADLLSFSKTSCEYEVRPAKGLINVDELPIYNGEINFPADQSRLRFKTFEEVLDDSPASEKESVERWSLLGGCLVNGFPCLLSADFLSSALHVTLMSVMAESLDIDNLYLKQTFDAVNRDMTQTNNPYTIDVIRTVLRRYGVLNNNKEENVSSWKLNRKEISRWYGIRALRKYVASTNLPIEEFLVRWKSTFPPFSPFNIEIEMLRGWFFKPTPNNIQYVSKETLPIDPKERFRVLFKLQSQWDLDDIVPFVDELNTKGMKIDNYIMKYARKKRVGKKSIVCSR